MVDFSVDTVEFFYSYEKYKDYEYNTSIVNPCSEISLDNWDTSNVSSVESMFADCHTLSSIPEGYVFAPYVPMTQIDIITETSKNYINSISISSRYSVINTNTDPIVTEIDKEIINKIFNEGYENRKKYCGNRME